VVLLTNILNIQGIEPTYAESLATAGINSIEKLLESGSSKNGRTGISQSTGISEKLILEWVNRADLTRVKGIGEKYSDLLEVAGVDTVVELSKRVPENLHAKMVEVNEANKRVTRNPTLSEVKSWIEQAKELPRMIQY
jgi:predicted flap endonuclease-1-like 5' DNA nuclease